MSKTCCECLEIINDTPIAIIHGEKGQHIDSDDYNFTFSNQNFTINTYCLSCFSEKIWLDDLETIEDFEKTCGQRCANCNLWFEGNLFFFCQLCEHSICSVNCISMTGCQTRECVCKSCYKGKCFSCGTNDITLPADQKYWLWDDDPKPICENCLLVEK